MAKDYAKFVPAKSRKPARWRRLISLLVAFFCAVFLLLAGTYCLLIMKKQTTLTAGPIHFNTLLAKAMAYADLKHASQHAIQKAKLSLNATQEPPPVHFDFYNELPNQRIKLTETLDAVPHYGIAVKTTLTNPKEKVVTASLALPAAPHIPQVIHPEEVSALIAAEDQVSAAQYALHLGSFEDRAAAVRFSEAIAGIGFNATVKKSARSGGSTFEVQQGPYANAALAKADQAKLQKRGITSDIRKL